jgi:hypothetical protein
LKKNKDVEFPPSPCSNKLIEMVIAGFCSDTLPEKFIEYGCAVCGQLTSKSRLFDLSEVESHLHILETSEMGVTRQERRSILDPILEIDGPVLVHGLNHVCISCKKPLCKDKMPKYALANGLWIGEIPDALKGLRYAEKMLIARFRHNKCIVRVSSGMRKMSANAITFAHPMPKIYNVLPPPKEELDEVLAFIFTGPCAPTQDDFKRCPMLVRRNKVAIALEWLKLNHIDYHDLEISYDNLNTYPEYGIPVEVNYRHSTTNKVAEAVSVHNDDEEDGTFEGECSFVVHGLTGEQLAEKGEHPDVMRMIAMAHLNNKQNPGKVLAIGHAKIAESLWNNPQLYPQMFPWLFPYGLGGIGNTLHHGKISDIAHKRHLLMYYDKRFQTDHDFALIAFNHEQIKDSTTGGFLLAEKLSFQQISDRLLSLDMDVLNSLATRMKRGEVVKPNTEEEKKCFQILGDLDHVANKVDGSMTKKKYMRNEIWALTCFRGAPSWYITLSPADVQHPICLYYADRDQEFKPGL